MSTATLEATFSINSSVATKLLFTCHAVVLCTHTVVHTYYHPEAVVTNQCLCIIPLIAGAPNAKGDRGGQVPGVLSPHTEGAEDGV